VVGESWSDSRARRAGSAVVFRLLRQLHAARQHEHRHRINERGSECRLQRLHRVSVPDQRLRPPPEPRAKTGSRALNFFT